MEKWFDSLLFDMMDMLLPACCGCIVMEWLNEEIPEYMEVNAYHYEETTLLLN